MDRLTRILGLALVLSLSGCASTGLSLKQKTVVSLQASETALEAAHDAERAICFISPSVESGPHCTNPLAAQVGLTDPLHQQLADVFSKAFGVEIQAAKALQAWKAGDPVPVSVVGYLTDAQGVLTVVSGSLPQTNTVVTLVQQAVTAAIQIIEVMGGQQ